jgi:type II secretion system protein N
MNMRRWLAILLVIPLLLLTLLAMTVLLVPDRELRGIVARSLGRAGYTFQAAGFGKSLPLGVTARNISIGDERGTLVTVDEAWFRLRFWPLLTGRVLFAYRARVGKGVVEGEFSPWIDPKGRLLVKGVRLEDIPFFLTVTDAKVKGALGVEGSWRGAGNARRGELRLEVKGADLADIKISGTPLPDAGYDTVQGALKIEGNKAILQSLTLQGSSLYVRLKGDFPVTAPLADAPLNLTLELMPKPEFLDRQKFVFLLLSKYLASPGYYQIPIRGMLKKPSIQ